jgi:hypothetical protein
LHADYVILSADANLSVSVNAEVDEEREFTLPQGSRVDSKSVLFFSAVFGVGQTSSIEFSININTRKIFSFATSTFIPKHSYHVMVPENLLKPDRENTIEFEARGYGTGGSAYVSDVVLLIQKE